MNSKTLRKLVNFVSSTAQIAASAPNALDDNDFQKIVSELVNYHASTDIDGDIAELFWNIFHEKVQHIKSLTL